jgi:hypothetical protein
VRKGDTPLTTAQLPGNKRHDLRIYMRNLAKRTGKGWYIAELYETPITYREPPPDLSDIARRFWKGNIGGWTRALLVSCHDGQCRRIHYNNRWRAS